MPVRTVGYNQRSVAQSFAGGQLESDHRLRGMDKAPRYHWSVLVTSSLMFLLISVLTSKVTEGAPTTASLLAPPTIAEDTPLNDALDRIYTPPEPTGHRITFFKNSHCQLHDGSSDSKATRSIVCGVRELNLPESAGDGVRFWTPRKCEKYHCQCIATRDVIRIKRTISDNKTDAMYKTFRMFECV